MLSNVALNPLPATAAPNLSARSRPRVVLVATSDSNLRSRLRHSLNGLRWQVIEAPSGAEAWLATQSAAHVEALLIDPWLPDLDVQEFLRDFHREHPQVDLTLTDGVSALDSPRSPYHQELLYALHRSQDGDTAAWLSAPPMGEGAAEAAVMQKVAAQLAGSARRSDRRGEAIAKTHGDSALLYSPGQGSEPGAPPPSPGRGSSAESDLSRSGTDAIANAPEAVSLAAKGFEAVITPARKEYSIHERLPELVGASPGMLEVSRRIRLVASRNTPVLIEGPTGSGKELVAEALHRLSSRARKPFVAINCAAIPESLLESELFGHTRGAFTGAVQGRTGRIESADGGTLFLDEIGEMPLALQSKLLRFFESGELQRIGDNETVKVDVRILTATHQPLAEFTHKKLFRADLYYRLAVFLIRTPALAEHMEDLPALVAHFLERMGRRGPVKRIDASAMAKLTAHSWPGNVRELEHVLDRAEILAGEEPSITAQEIDFGLSLVN